MEIVTKKEGNLFVYLDHRPRDFAEGALRKQPILGSILQRDVYNKYSIEVGQYSYLVKVIDNVKKTETVVYKFKNGVFDIYQDYMYELEISSPLSPRGEEGNRLKLIVTDLLNSEQRKYTVPLPVSENPVVELQVRQQVTIRCDNHAIVYYPGSVSKYIKLDEFTTIRGRYLYRNERGTVTVTDTRTGRAKRFQINIPYGTEMRYDGEVFVYYMGGEVHYVNDQGIVKIPVEGQIRKLEIEDGILIVEFLKDEILQTYIFDKQEVQVYPYSFLGWEWS